MLAGIIHQIESLPQHEGDETADERGERSAIVATRQAIAAQREGEAKRQREALQRLDAAIAALPAPFDVSQIERARRSVEEAQRAFASTEAAYVKALRDQQSGEELRRRTTVLEDRLIALDMRMRRIEDHVGLWLLFAKCMSNDGLIALSIDDSGPTLSSLANDLLLACYGPRFTVSLKTLVETAKGETREGFDIVVHDAESGEAKSVTQMSAGERVWISCRSRHEIHYAENPDMPSGAEGDRGDLSLCEPKSGNVTRHKTPSPPAINSYSSWGKSISLMSGGERIWIDACLTRAIALYLAQHSGRCYETLFSDEADGPLDPEHKRMFMQMKREVLRLGGYGREFFITQTPELAAMADVIIDLDAMRVSSRA
jgi:exonuclease SbcC